jgi:Tfp pilus assembly protein PilW
MEHPMRKEHFVDERGESLLSMLVAILISGIVLSASTSFFLNSLHHSTDIRSFTRTQVAASSLLDLMSFELRMLGSGMPLTQASFSYENPTISGLALPILLSSSASEITFRLNETGASALLTSNFSPSSGSHTLSVDSTVGFKTGDSVYLTSLSTGGVHGLHGIVQSTTATSIQLSTYNTTQDAHFPASSLIQPVSEITYASSPNGVTRTSSQEVTTHLDHAAFELVYLDSSGQSLPLPLSATTIRESLAGIRVLVQVEALSRFGGAVSATEAQQTIALRNLILSR